jgi:hypothetical protein
VEAKKEEMELESNRTFGNGWKKVKVLCPAQTQK